MMVPVPPNRRKELMVKYIYIYNLLFNCGIIMTVIISYAISGKIS